ncbi:GDP-L-fucose synthase [Polystyrenella longa]|uniref:GDP-L-fucose synthase n=1 Tax=Polystyrenella longa TaxID=2528007 RepID=A0A518CIN5_9PLAN|nr:GDP-L-fucose synthase [Polystyrenella longa]QDU79080.1 GDP-L-fucose synthase [Polystyrenella longa]
MSEHSSLAFASQTELAFPLTGRKIWVAGHTGLVGSAICRHLQQEDCKLLTASRAELDLLRQAKTEAWVAEHQPDVIIIAAAKVGGIWANDHYPAEFIYQNLTIETNIIEAARKAGVAKLLLLGSSCIYPREAEQPIQESALLSRPLEPTNQWYAIAKIAGIKLCQAYRKQYGLDMITAMPTNLYGPGDRYDEKAGHVIPALIQKMHIAKTERAPEVPIWGTGNVRREFLYVDDCARALIHLVKHYSAAEPVNVGSGIDITIRELAETVQSVVGYEGQLKFDPTMLEGTPRKLLDVSKLTNLGWQPTTPLEAGLPIAYDWYRQHECSVESLSA